MAQMRHFLENGCVKVRTMGSEPEGGCAPAHPLTLHIAVPRDAGNAKETGRDQRYRSRQMHRMRDLLQVVQPRRVPPRHRPEQGFALHGGVPCGDRHSRLQCPHQEPPPYRRPRAPAKNSRGITRNIYRKPHIIHTVSSYLIFFSTFFHKWRRCAIFLRTAV